MKAILEFGLPEEREEYRDAVNGVNYRCCLNDIRNYLRLTLKHSALSPAEHKAYEDIQNQFYKALEENECLNIV